VYPVNSALNSNQVNETLDNSQLLCFEALIVSVEAMVERLNTVRSEGS
jgi:hypothetical protein